MANQPNKNTSFLQHGSSANSPSMLPSVLDDIQRPRPALKEPTEEPVGHRVSSDPQNKFTDFVTTRM